MFSTILLGRAGSGSISPVLNRGAWRVIKTADLVSGADGRVMAYAGPLLLVLIVATWVVVAITGFALIYQPLLAIEIAAGNGPTDTDFATAVYFSGFNFSTLGLGDLVPRTTYARLLTVVEACTGFAVFTMGVSYTLNIYETVNDRDALALLLHADTGLTDDPAVALAGLCPGGSPSSDAGSSLHALSDSLSLLLQTHYAYPLAHYYRRREPHLSMVQIVDHSLMIVALAKACLAEEPNAALLRSRGFISLDAAGTQLIGETVSMLRISERHVDFDPEMMHPWFDRAFDRLGQAGIHLVPRAAAWAEFELLACRFKPKVLGLAAQLGYRESDFTGA